MSEDHGDKTAEALRAEADQLAQQIILGSAGDTKRTREAGDLIITFVNEVMRRRGLGQDGRWNV